MRQRGLPLAVPSGHVKVARVETAIMGRVFGADNGEDGVEVTTTAKGL